MTGATQTLTFAVTGARPDRTSLTPILNLGLRLTVPPGSEVQSIVLRCQVRVEPSHRPYDDDEQVRLHDLFGAPRRWGETLKAFPLTHVTLPVRGFTDTTEVTLPVEFSYDLEVAAGKYLHSLRAGEIPLLLLFSGTIFLRDGGATRVEQIPWDLEARYRLPVATWQELMDLHYPQSGWLRLRRETIDALQAYKTQHALATWEDTLAHLLAEHRATT